MKATRTCNHPDGCPKPAVVRGWCNGHYERWRLKGDIGPSYLRPIRPGATCEAEGCERSIRGGGFGLCTMHYRRFRKHGDPLHVDQPSLPPPNRPGALNSNWKGDDVGYIAMHERVANRFGKAASHSCHDCGGQAAEWSYTHDCPAERISTHGPYPLPYSVDPTRYVPRCRSCHTKFDRWSDEARARSS